MNLKLRNILTSLLITSLIGLSMKCKQNHNPTCIQPICIIADIQNGVHGITFSSNGDLIVATHHNLQKVNTLGQVSPFTTLKHVTDTTRIWNMKYDPDGNLYCAAKDFLIMITPQGKQKILANEKFTGRWGICDLAFDQRGNIYTVHGKTISRYDKDGNRQDMFTQILSSDSIKALVGITFDKTFNNLFVSDVFGQQVIQIPFKSDDKNIKAQFYKLDGYPEYFAWTKDNSLVVSSPGKKRSKLFQLNNGRFIQLEFANGDSIQGLNTITFGQTPFLEDAAYGLGHGKLYEMALK